MTRNYEYECLEESAARESFWLVVRREQKNATYEFGPDGDTTVVVGSASSAQICVPGAAPIAFYLERLGNDLCLTPCYSGADLRVDSEAVRGRRTISERAVVELMGLRLELRVRDTPPTIPGDRVEQESPDGFCPRSAESGHATESTTMSSTNQLRTVALERRRLSNAGLSSAKTLDMAVFDPDRWFDTTFPTAASTMGSARPTDVSQSSKRGPAELKRVTAPPRPRSSASKAQFDPMKIQEFAPIGPMTVDGHMEKVELKPMAKSPALAPGGEQTGPCAERPRLPSPSELYRTVELVGTDVRIAVPTVEPTRSKPVTMNRTLEIAIPTTKRSSDTTDFEVLAVEGVSGQLASQGWTPTSATPSNVKPSVPDDASTPKQGLVQVRREVELLEQLGLLTKRRPVLVLGGATLGTLVLVLCFAGVANLVGPQPRRMSERQYAIHSAAAAPTARLPTAESSVSSSAGLPGAVPTAADVAAPRADGDGPSVARLPDTTVAVGHLFAGRLPEAEQAYRELATHFPNDPAFRSTSRILSRRNSAKCRGMGDAKSSCPTVKP